MLAQALADSLLTAKAQRTHTAQALEELLERGKFPHQRRGGLVTHARHPGDVVHIITGECQIVGKALGSYAVVALDIVVAELAAEAVIPEQIAAAHQLRHILVPRDVSGRNTLLAHRARQCADNVIGLVFGAHEHRYAQISAQLTAAFELCSEPRRLRLTIRLIGGVNAAAIGIRAPLVEGDGDVARPYALDQIAEKARKTEHGVDGVAVAIHHVGQHRVIGAEDVDRSVDEEYQS